MAFEQNLEVDVPLLYQKELYQRELLETPDSTV